MTCQLNYIDSKAISQEYKDLAYDIHNNIESDLIKLGFKKDSIGIVNRNITTDSITKDYGNVLSTITIESGFKDKDYLVINALNSNQYLNKTIDDSILGYSVSRKKGVYELTTKELLYQDKKLSPLQFSDKMKIDYYEEFYKDYNYDKAIESLLKKDIVYTHVYTKPNGEYVGLYQYKDEINPNYKNNGGDLESAKLSVLKDAEVIKQSTETKPQLQSLETYIETLNYEQKVLLKRLLDILGENAPQFKIEIFDKLLENGDRAFTDFRDSVIQIGSNADFSDITEEIFHVIVEMLDPKLLESFYGKIEHTNIYREVVAIYGNDTRYKDNPNKLKHEAIVKLITQLSQNVPIENYLLTKDKGILRSIGEAIKELLKNIYNLFKDIEHDDFYNLTESIMYNEVKYTKNDLTDKGVFASKSNFAEDKFILNSQGDTIYSIDTKLKSINSLTISKDALVDNNKPSVFTQELEKVINALKVTNNYTEILKIKILKGDETKYTSEQTKIIDNIYNLLDEVHQSFGSILYVDRFTAYSNNDLFVHGENTQNILTDVITSEGIREQDFNLTDQQSKPINTTIPNQSTIGLNQNRTQKIVIEQTAFEDNVKFFESLVGTKITNLMNNLSRRLTGDIKRLQKLGINHPLDDNLVKAIRSRNDIEDFRGRISALYGSMNEFNNLFKTLSSDLNTMEGLSLHNYSDISINLKSWKPILEEIKEQLSEEARKGNIHQKYSEFIAVFENNLNNLKRVLDDKISHNLNHELYNIVNKFNEALENDLQSLDEKYQVDGVIPESAIPLYEKARDLLVQEYNKKKITQEQLYSMLIQNKGKNDIDTDSSTWNLTPMFDRYLVNVRFANDPILASFGRILDEIYNKADIEFMDVLDSFNEIALKIKEEGGEKEVGKKLTRIVNRVVYSKVKETIHGVEVYIYKPKKVSRLEYINKWGDKDAYIVNGYTSSLSINGEIIENSYGSLKAEIENNTIILEKISKDNKEAVKTLTDKLSELKKIKSNFERTYFHKENKQEYYDIVDLTLDKYSKSSKISLDELTKAYNEKRELMNSKLTERNQLLSQSRNIIVDDNNRQYFVELKSKIAKITGEISSMYIVKDINSLELDTTLAKIFNDIRDQQDGFKDKIPNLNVFIRDFQLMLNSIDQNDRDLVNDLIKTNGVIDTDEKVILNKLIEFHRNTKKEAATDSLNLQIVMKFLEDAIWYKPTDDYYAERQIHYDTIVENSLLLRNQDYIALTFKGNNDNQSVIDAAKIQYPESEPYFTVLKEFDAEFIKGTPNIGFSSLSDIRTAYKEGKLGTEGYALLILDSGGIEMSVLTQYGKPIKTNLKATSSIDDLWKSIIDDTKSYRDKFGYVSVHNMDDKTKVRIQANEQQIYFEIYDLMTQPQIKGIGLNNKQAVKEIKDKIKEASEKIDRLQHDVINEGYYDDLQDVFTKFNFGSISLFNELSKIVDDSKLFRSTYWQNLQTLKNIIGHIELGGLENLNLNQVNEIIAKINEDPDVDKRLKVGKEQINKINEADLQILKFLQKNHVIKIHLGKYENGVEVVAPPLVESYINRKVVPTNLNHIDKHFDNKYISTVFNQVTGDELKDYKGDYLPLEYKFNEILGDENKKLVEDYKDLQDNGSENLKDIYQEWVENTHIAKQKQIAIENPTRIARQSYLGYTVPHMEKQYSELGWWEAIKEFWNELIGKRNPNESGEFNFDTGEVENTEKKKFLQKYKEMLSKFFNRSKLSYNKSRRYIPVDYTRHIEGEHNTQNIFLASSSYLSSLIKTNQINNNMFKISAVRNTLVNNNPYKEDGESYKRLNVINNTIDAEIYRNNIGENNGLTNALRLIKKLLVVKTQSLASVTGWTKNLEAGLLQNYITSLNVPKNFYWNRLKKDTATTYKALQFAIDASRNGITGETLTQFLARQLNPQHKNVKELFRNSERWNPKNLVFDGKILFAGMKFGETIISYQLLLDVAQRIQFNTESDGSGDFIDFLDIFEKDGSSWKIKRGIYDAEGNQVELSSLIEIKRLIDSGRFQTMGHSKFKGTIFNNSYIRSLFFFVNYLVPLMQGVLLNNRRDFVANRVVNNFNLEFLNYIGKTLKYLMNGRWYWNYMTTGQKQSTAKAIVMYTTLFGLVTILKYLFGFDPDDKDAYKKLKGNSWIENFALITVLKSASEIEQQSLFNPLSKTMLPVVTANWDAIRNPMLVRLITDLGKASQLSYETLQYETGLDDNEDEVFYDKANKQYGIEKGESKLAHALNKFNPLRSQNFDMGLQTRIYQQMSNR